MRHSPIQSDKVEDAIMARYLPVMTYVRAYRALGSDWVIYVGWWYPDSAESVFGPGVLPAVVEAIDAAAALACDYWEK